MIEVTFPDGAKKKFKKGITGLEIAQGIGSRLANDAVAVKIDGEVMDLKAPIQKGGKIQILTFKDKEGKEVFWHSASHLMSQAILRIFKDQNIGLGVGPAVEEGFYQDYDMKPIHPEDLERIEKEMQKIADEKLEITYRDASKGEVLKFYKNDPYKTEMAKQLPGDTVTMYDQGEFHNLCKGPHVPNTSCIKAFKLMKIAGAYWRGDAKNKQLQRIYGVAFPDKKELKEYLHMLEEAEKRDHRKLGKDLGLFSIHDEAPGMPFFHDKGTFIWNTLVEFMREKMKARGYEENKTPIILNKALWLQSGHWEHYKENMYFTKIDDADFAVKPMNCPGNLLVYKSTSHSYKDLPIKAGEFGLVHRHELSGVLSGLFRVRSFTQDDAHVFCTEEQLQEQITELIDLVEEVYSAFGFEYSVELSTMPEKAMGSREVWDKAENALKHALNAKKMEFKINEGQGAFYGPKIDFHVKDAIGRTWQCGTIQVDSSMPEKFDLTYDGKDGKKHRPVMLHRAIYGSIERFLGILIEHYVGKFPLWLSPVQAIVLSVADRHNGYAQKVIKQMKDSGLRVEADLRSESIPKKVRDAQAMKIPYIIVVGDKEEKDGTVAVRTRDNVVQGEMNLEEFASKVVKEIKERKN